MKYLRATIKTLGFFAITFGLYGVWYIASFVIPNKQFWRQFIFEKWANAFVALAGIQVEVVGDDIVQGHEGVGFTDPQKTRGNVLCHRYLNPGEMPAAAAMVT